MTATSQAFLETRLGPLPLPTFVLVSMTRLNTSYIVAALDGLGSCSLYYATEYPTESTVY